MFWNIRALEVSSPAIYKFYKDRFALSKFYKDRFALSNDSNDIDK